MKSAQCLAGDVKASRRRRRQKTVTSVTCVTASSIVGGARADRSGVLSPGDPVALNPKHHVLAAGDYRFNVLSV